MTTHNTTRVCSSSTMCRKLYMQISCMRNQQHKHALCPGSIWQRYRDASRTLKERGKSITGSLCARASARMGAYTSCSSECSLSRPLRNMHNNTMSQSHTTRGSCCSCTTCGFETLCRNVKLATDARLHEIPARSGDRRHCSIHPIVSIAIQRRPILHHDDCLNS